jgi:hypothetical protein
MDNPIGEFLGKGNVIYHVLARVGDDPAILLLALIPNPRILIDRR